MTNRTPYIYYARVMACLFAILLTMPRLMAQNTPIPDGQSLETELPKRESRAVWLTLLNGLDWPKAKATSEAGREAQKQELRDILDQLKAININTILLQTRVRGSVAYPSKIEPWDVALTGQYNRDPGYDPLAFAIEEAHKRGMELHAWVVTVPMYKVAQAKSMGKEGLQAKHPAWVRKLNEQYYLDPGLPETAEYLASICEEIVSGYDVDGIHFDYIRYPENAPAFPDGDTYKKYGQGQNKAKWRRDNITRIVRTIHTRVKALKPWVRISSSPVGKFRDLSRFPARGWNCYDAVHQDAQGWLREGIHDALYPMMYFKGNNFYPFAADWREQDRGRMVAPGLGIYFLDPKEGNWKLGDVVNELHYTRSLRLGGQCYFRSRFLTNNTQGLYDYLQHTFYAYPSLTPAATWIDDVPPTAPTDLQTDTLSDGRVTLSWQPSTDNLGGGLRYNVYAVRTMADVERAECLVASALPQTCYTYQPGVLAARGLHLVVRAMDRCGNESPVVLPGKEEPVLTFDAAVRDRFDVPTVQLPKNGTISLPERDADFYAVTDVQGRILRTGPYVGKADLSTLPAGWYDLRTLTKKGRSARVLRVWKGQ